MARQRREEQQLPSGWEPCPPGRFDRLAKQVRARRRRRAFLRTAAVTATTLLIGGGGLGLWLAAGRTREYGFGGISCVEVERLAERYAAGQLGSPLREQVAQHLAQCPRCRLMFQKPERATT